MTDTAETSETTARAQPAAQAQCFQWQMAKTMRRRLSTSSVRAAIEAEDRRVSMRDQTRDR